MRKHREGQSLSSRVDASRQSCRTPARWCFEQYFAELDTRFGAASILGSVSRPTPTSSRCRPVCSSSPACATGQSVWSPQTSRRRAGRVEEDVDRTGRSRLGLGLRILGELERHAREAGVAVIRLETNHALTEAIVLYRRSGYVEVDAFNNEPYAHHWFEKHLS
jgi:hypothetical protein